jgi:hypothetical protein
MSSPSITVYLSAECWELLHWIAIPAPPSGELKDVIDAATRQEIRTPEPTFRYVLSLLRPQALELSHAIARACAPLPVNDRHRRIWERALRDIEAAIRRASEA